MSITSSEISRAVAQKLVAAYRGGQRVPADPSALGALSRVQALDIQREVVSALAVPIAGWKVAALPDGDLISAPILRNRLLPSPASICPAIYGLGGVECEIAFRIAREPIPGREGFAKKDIIEAVEGACSAIEVVDSRWATTFSTPRNAMIADLLSNGALVLGALNKNWRDVTFGSLGARLEINGRTVCQSTGGHPDGDLIGLLVNFANDLRKRGVVLRSGDVITTGSYTGFHTAKSGDEIIAEFDGFSSVSVTFE
ncbi:fumarylacetoacetate hydrolase family protein [Mesorhizobium sp. M0643]|uniref:2-keto-4-pentenoate hydratase n=1 Tax=Mesorhizobium sp. M0643 TaxID=2956978 RepID=UPI00333C4B3F